MGFSEIFENGNKTTHVLFWLKNISINFFAGTVSYTFLEMYFTPE